VGFAQPLLKYQLYEVPGRRECALLDKYCPDDIDIIKAAER